MAYTEREEFKLEIIPPYYIIKCRRSNIVEKDGVEIGRQQNRTMNHQPGDDMSNACSEAQAVASVLWTQEIIDEFQALQQQPAEDTSAVE